MHGDRVHCGLEDRSRLRRPGSYSEAINASFDSCFADIMMATLTVMRVLVCQHSDTSEMRNGSTNQGTFSKYPRPRSHK